MFKSYFGCSVEERKNRMFKVTPPPVGCGIWYWNRVPFFIYKVRVSFFRIMSVIIDRMFVIADQQYIGAGIIVQVRTRTNMP